MSKQIFFLLSLGLFISLSQACLATRGVWINNNTDQPLDVTGQLKSDPIISEIPAKAQKVPTGYFQEGSPIRISLPTNTTIHPKSATDISNRFVILSVPSDPNQPFTLTCSIQHKPKYDALVCVPQ